VAFWLLERENTLADFSAFDRWAQALFNATVPRSSGFQSVAPGRFMPATLIMVMFLMWVGGASQSTAGGVKVNTLATLWLSLKNTVLGREHVTAFNRTISPASIQRAMAVVTLSVLFFMTYTVLLLIMEPNLPAKGLVFEIISALFTVGSSLGVTASLSAASKVLLCTAMFLGRVGTISLLIGVTGNRSAKPVQYPIDNVIIN
jgi:Trk-type K+ transport system membrane component